MGLLHCIKNNIEKNTLGSPEVEEDDQLDEMETDLVVETVEEMLTAMLEITAILWEGLKYKEKSEHGLSLSSKLMSEVKGMFPSFINYFQVKLSLLK